MELENSNPSNAYSVLIITISIFFALIMSLMAIRPLIVENAKIRDKQKIKTAELKRYTEKKDILKRIKEDPLELGKLKNMETKIFQILPAVDDRTTTYAHTDEISKKSEITIGSVIESSNNPLEGMPTIREYSFTVAAQGTYEELIKTLKNFESTLKLFNIKTISLAPGKDDDLSYSLIISTYSKDEVQLEDQ